MKKIASIFLLGALFASCNDGDMVYEELKFDGSVLKCPNKDIFYKLSGSQMLFTYLPGKINDQNPLPLDQEFSYTTTTGNDIVYRQYSDRAIAGSICDLITPSVPGVVEEFSVIPGGQITYKRIRKINRKEDENKIDLKYVYSFVFKNITLTNGTKEMKYETYNFGEYVDSNVSLHFNFINDFTSCANNDWIVIDNNQGIKMHIQGFEFPRTATTKTYTLDSNNYLNYLYFKGGTISASMVCDLTTLPSQIKLAEDWKTTTGTVKVVSTAVSPPENPNVITGYNHVVTLVTGEFKSGSGSFIIKDQVLGTYYN